MSKNIRKSNIKISSSPDTRHTSRKRLRQTSIKELFTKQRRQLDDNMDERESMRETLAKAAEERIAKCKIASKKTETSTKEVENCSSGTEVCSGVIDVEKVNKNTTDPPKDKADNAVKGTTENDVNPFQLSQELFPDNEIPDTDGSFALFLSSSSDTDIEVPEVVPASRTSVFKFPPLTANHTVMFKLPNCQGISQHVSEKYRDAWDCNHVRMPCSPHNLYPIENEFGEKKIVNRWEVIQQSLLKPMSSSLDIEEAILSYNKQYADKWNFSGLHAFFSEVLTPQEVNHFFKTTFPAMVKLALCLPDLCTEPIPLLKEHRNHSITMSQKQAGCLLANAFFCTFPRRNTRKKNGEFSTYPDINFDRLYIGCKEGIVRRKSEKLKCLLNYFRRITSDEQQGTLTFQRKCLSEFPKWLHSKTVLRKMDVRSEGLIEKDGVGMMQVDFANKFVGGGVLGMGSVQEEIRFLICPELLVSRLFTEKLDANECLIVTGCEQYNNYSGYGDTFEWAGDHKDNTPRDEWGRRCTQVVAMDALHFYNPNDQYRPQLVLRELNKAFCSFHEPGHGSGNLPPVATGNWGCGAFRGDPQLKSLIQLMAASEAGRDIVYFTFGNGKLKAELKAMYELLTSRKLTIGDIFTLIHYYYTIVCSKGRPTQTLFSFIQERCEKVPNLISASKAQKDFAESATGTNSKQQNSDSTESSSCVEKDESSASAEELLSEKTETESKVKKTSDDSVILLEDSDSTPELVGARKEHELSCIEESSGDAASCEDCLPPSSNEDCTSSIPAESMVVTNSVNSTDTELCDLSEVLETPHELG